MQKYLLSFVITGNPNSLWVEDKTYWPQYGTNASQIVLSNSTTFDLGVDDLATNRSLFWNKALWY
jgi:carboxylesterase type B